MPADYIKQRTITNDGEIVYQENKRYYNPFKENRGYNFKYKSSNIRSYLDIPLPNEFTDSEIGKLTRLSRHIYSDSNMLARRAGGKITAYTKEDAQEIVGLSRARFSNFWRKAVKHRIIKTIVLDNQEFICFNPIYFNSTTYIPIHLYLAFQTELSRHLPEWVVERYLDMAAGAATKTGKEKIKQYANTQT